MPTPRRFTLSTAAHTVALTVILAVALLALVIFVFPTPHLSAQSDPAQSDPEALGQLSGVVTNNNGDPLAGIVVTLEQYGDQLNYPKMTATSNATGDYHFAGVLPGIYRVRLSDPAGLHADRFYQNALMPAEATQVTVSGNHVENINQSLVAGNAGAISVTLALNFPLTTTYSLEAMLYRQAASGQWLVYRTLMQIPPTQTELRFAGLPFGVYRFCTRFYLIYAPPLYMCHENIIPNNTASFIDEATDIVIDSVVPKAITLNFAGGSQIRGTVVAPNGQPLAGIPVRIIPIDSYPSLTESVTDAQGQFFFNAPSTGRIILVANPNTYQFPTTYPAGEPYLATYYPNSYTLAGAEQILIEPTTQLSVTFKLTEGGSIAGKALLPTGDPLVNPTIKVLRWDEPTRTWGYPCWDYMHCPQTQYNAETGHYTVTKIIPTNYRVAAEFFFALPSQNVAGYYGGGTIADADDLTVIAGKTRTGIDITVGEAGFDGMITGTVTYNGALLPGIEVSLHSWYWGGIIDRPLLTAITDAQGQYQLNGLSVGYYRVRYRDPQGRYAGAFFDYIQGPLYVSGTQPTPNVNFAFTTEAGSIRGRVITPDGESKADYRIYVYALLSPPYGAMLNHIDVTTDATGQYEITGLPPGQYLVAAHPPELPPFNQYPDRYYPGTGDMLYAQPVTVEANVVTEQIDIPFAAPGVRLPFITNRGDGE